MQSKQEIYILTEVFPPHTGATGMLLSELAYRLSKDFSVQVITAVKNNAGSAAGFDDKKKPFSIKRTNSFIFDKNRKIGRIVNGLLFFVKTLFYLASIKKDAYVLIVSNPPFMPLLGLLFYKLRKQPFFYLVHDLYPEIAVNLGYLKKSSPVTRLWKRLNSSIFAAARKVIFLGDYMARETIKYYPVLEYNNNYRVIPNWSNRENIYPVKNKNQAKKEFGLEGKFIVQYSGNIGLFHNTRVMLEAASRLTSYSDIEFHIIGRGGCREELIQEAREKKLTNVVFKDFVDAGRLNASLNCADLAVITLDSRARNLCVPSKFYTIIAAGLPVLGIMDSQTDIGQEIAANEFGFLADPGDIDGICSFIVKLYNDRVLCDNYARNARSYFVSKYDIIHIERMYINLFKTTGKKMIDLHTHTSASDGVLSPEKLILKARDEGITAIAVTDHDTVDGVDEAVRLGAEFDIEVVPGLELSCYHKEMKQEIHMLGLFINHTDKKLLTLLDRLHEYRYKRNVTLLENLKANDVHISAQELLDDCNKTLYNVGKPNIARLLYKKGYVRNEMEAMKKYLDDTKGLAKTEKIRISSQEAIDAIHSAGGLAILAHPGTLDRQFQNPEEFETFIGELAEYGLDGIEVYYHGYKKNKVKSLKKIASMYNLLKSGGSDFHSDRGFRLSKLGFYGIKKNIPADILEQLKRRLP